jgi:hypothetical protein
LFETYKNTRPGIFALHDEDAANLLINRYNYTTCLPLVDIEEIPYIDMDIFHNYRYGSHPVSDNLVLPQHENDILVFHGFKNPEFEIGLKDNYLKTVLSQDDFLIKYEPENKRIIWEKNSFLGGKRIYHLVRFEVLKNNQILECLNNQSIWDYWGFFIDNCNVESGYYDVRIVEESTNRVIYKNTIKI